MTPTDQLAAAEAAYLDARSARDALDVARARGDPADRTSLEQASAAAFDAARRAVADLGDRRDELEPEDRQALATMTAGLETAAAYVLPGVTAEAVSSRDGQASRGTSPGDSAARASATRGDARTELERAYAAAAEALPFEGRRLTRPQILDRLANEPDRARRRSLFLALGPLWRAVDGDGVDVSPYRALLPASAARWRAGHSPIAANATSVGVDRADIEGWAMTILEAWREAYVEPVARRAGPPVEPWDWWWHAGEARRLLAPALPVGALQSINIAVHASLGADLDALGILFDTAPRPGRPPVPVAFTTFGERPHRRRDGGWHSGRPVVLETLTEGGLGELAELLHETGHAIHIAGIRTRPAFADWPDSDAFTEALAELVALDVFDPAWQRRWIPGAPVVAPSVAARARWAEVALDAAWAVFEVRLHASPERRPNDVWTEITSTWLGISAHPELSWWAMRGQLVDAPGYMANYAVGAVLAADVRRAVRSERGSWVDGDPGWYPWVREHVYRFGLERTPADVLRNLLGRPPTVDALLADIAGTAAT